MARSNNTAELEGLVIGPYRWNAVTYSSFFRDVYDNVIKAEVERLQNNELEKRKQAELANTAQNINSVYKNNQNNDKKYDPKVAQLVQQMIKESDKVLGNEDWVNKIGTELWNNLKLDEFGKDRYKLDRNNETAVLKRKSVVQLLKFIRNKISHIRTCRDEMKEKLTQFFDKDNNGQYHFNENKFVKFWIYTFPKLVPYLWIKLYEFKDILGNYYPESEIDISKLKYSLMDLNSFEKELKIALVADMENGNVFKRFMGQGCSLEFRGFYNLVKILDRNDFVVVTVNSMNNVFLSVTHSSTSEDKLEYKEKSSNGAEKFILIFTDNITDKKIWKYCSNCDCRVIVFCDPDKLNNDKVESAVVKFNYENDLAVELSESPIKGIELSIEKQDKILERGQVCIQGGYIKIKDIILERCDLLEILSGNLLNKILKNEKPVLFADYKYPEYKGIYINRRIFFASRNVNEVKNIVSDNTDTFEMLSGELFYKLLGKKHAKVCGNSECALHRSANKTQKVHFYGDKGPGKDVFSENKFLLKMGFTNIKSIYLIAESGMGKSKLFLSLGKKLKNSLVIFSTFRHFVDLVKNYAKENKCEKLHIKSVILDILGCQNECEWNVINKWLDRKIEKGARVELQLDGLDEVPSANLEMALGVIKIIKKDFKAIRLWISSSNPFPGEESEFKFTFCNILPFSFENKIQFYKQACRANPIRLTEKTLKEHTQGLRLKLMFCKDLLEFLDYPLNYSMLVELYEDNLTELKFLSVIDVGVELFENVYKKKFSRMYCEKKGISFDENDDDYKMQRENYFQIHTYLALVHLFPAVSNDFVEPQGVEYFTKGNCHKMGIITNYDPITFIHLKYADFFVARFIMKALETGKLVICPKNIFYDLFLAFPKKHNRPERPFIWKLLDEYLGKLRDWGSLKWVKTQNTENLNRISRVKEISGFLIIAFKYSFWNLATLWVKLWVDEKDTSFCHQILHLGLLFGAPSSWFLSVCDKLSYDNEYELIISSVQNVKYEVAMHLIEHKCGDDVFDKIAESRKGSGGILHLIANRIKYGNVLMITENFVENTIDFIKFVCRKSPKELNRRDSNGLTFLLALPPVQKSRQVCINSEQVFLLKEFLVNEMNVDVSETSYFGESVLSLGNHLNCHYCPFHNDNETWCEEKLNCVNEHCKEEHDRKNALIYHKTLALATSKNFSHINSKSYASGLMPLQEAVRFFGSILRKDTLELFRAFGANFNELDGKGDTILHYSVKNCDDIEFIKFLVMYGSKIDTQNGAGMCALCLAEKERKVELVTCFRVELKLKEKQKCPLNCTIPTK